MSYLIHCCNRTVQEIIVTVQGVATYRCTSCYRLWSDGSEARPSGTIYFWTGGDFWSLAPGAERPVKVKDTTALRFCRKALDATQERNNVGASKEAENESQSILR